MKKSTNTLHYKYWANTLKSTTWECWKILTWHQGFETKSKDCWFIPSTQHRNFCFSPLNLPAILKCWHTQIGQLFSIVWYSHIKINFNVYLICFGFFFKFLFWLLLRLTERHYQFLLIFAYCWILIFLEDISQLGQMRNIDSQMSSSWRTTFCAIVSFLPGWLTTCLALSFQEQSVLQLWKKWYYRLTHIRLLGC